MNPRNNNIEFTTNRKWGWLQGLAIILAILVLGVLLGEIAPDGAVAVGFLLMLAGIIGVVYPITQIGLTSRGFSAAVLFVGFSLVGQYASVEEDAIRSLKADNPDAYLSELRKISEIRWRAELEEMRPAEYAALVMEERSQAAQAAEARRRIEEEERRAAEAAKLAQDEAARRAAEAVANYEAYEASRKARDERRSGFHCLSEWDGSHRAFKNEVHGMMRDPDSFEHIETRVTPDNGNGSHIIIMTYRARNGFGGMNVGTARGIYRSDNCEATVLAIE